MAAVGNYEVVTDTFGPFILAMGTQFGTVPAPTGKVILGATITSDRNSAEVFAEVEIALDGTEVAWTTLAAAGGSHSVTVRITCAEMG